MVKYFCYYGARSVLWKLTPKKIRSHCKTRLENSSEKFLTDLLCRTMLYANRTWVLSIVGRYHCQGWDDNPKPISLTICQKCGRKKMTITIFVSTLPKYNAGFYLCITLMTENLQFFFLLYLIHRSATLNWLAAMVHWVIFSLLNSKFLWVSLKKTTLKKPEIAHCLEFVLKRKSLMAAKCKGRIALTFDE